MYYVYILRCGDGSLYTGSTNDVERRLAVHRSGKGAKYTRSRLPVELVYQETWPDRPGALRREAAIKRLTRPEKLALIGKKEEYSMLKKNLERSAEFAWEVAEHSHYGVLSLASKEGTPYAVPLSPVRIGEAVYFHCAMQGRKTEILRENARACMTWVGETELYPEHFTVLYSSAIAVGSVHEVTDEAEKKLALRRLCERYAPDKADTEETVEKGVGHTAIWKMTVEEITGKTNRDFYKKD